MKKWIGIIVVVVLTAGSVQAQLLAYENFDYGVGVSLTNASNGGTGWTDGWKVDTVDGLTTSGSDQSLYFCQQNDGLINDGSTHIWSATSKGNRRDFNGVIDLSSETLYFSALIRAYAGTTTGGAADGHMRFLFYDGANGSGNMRANVGVTDGTLFAAAYDGFYGDGDTNANAFVDNTTYLLVMKRNNSGIFASLIEADGDDETFASEPVSWQVNENLASGVNLTSVRLLMNGDGDGGIRVDELRIAKDWDSVVDGILVPIVGTVVSLR